MEGGGGGGEYQRVRAIIVVDQGILVAPGANEFASGDTPNRILTGVESTRELEERVKGHSLSGNGEGQVEGEGESRGSRGKRGRGKEKEVRG